jgi:hypothetical protein
MASGLTFDIRFAAVPGEKGKGFFIQDARVLRKLGFHIAQVRPLADYCRVVANRIFRLPLENDRIDTPTRGGNAPLAKTPPDHFSHTSMARTPHSSLPEMNDAKAADLIEAKVSESNTAKAINRKVAPTKPRRLPLLFTFLLMVLAYLATLYLLAIGWPHL